MQIAVENLLKRSDQITGDAEQKSTLSPMSIDSLKKARADVLSAGKNFCHLTSCCFTILAEQLLAKGNEFAQNTSDQRSRQEIVEHGRLTLLAVARLLIVADMVDARKIEEAAEYVCFNTPPPPPP